MSTMLSFQDKTQFLGINQGRETNIFFKEKFPCSGANCLYLGSWGMYL